MANVLYDSFLNPVKFHKLDPAQSSNYLSRFMDDWQFRRTIQPWQSKVCFYQPWLQADTVHLQYTSNFGPLVLRMYDQDGLLVHTQAFDTKHQDELRPTFYIRQIAVDLAPFSPGKFYFVRDAAGVLHHSEPFEILPPPEDGIFLEDQDPTLYIEYKHYESAGGLKFFVPFLPTLRVPGILRYKTPGAKDNIYEDQLLNQTLINSVPFRVWEFIVGGNYGVPPYFIDRVARVCGMSDLSIDGRLYTKNEGANFEGAPLDFYPMQGWSIELREKLNREVVINEDENVIEGIAAAALLIDNKGFGLDGGDTSYQEINYLQ